jgi:hypothetical protein
VARTTHRNMNWELTSEFSWNHANLGMLMDIRDELRRLNNLLHCSNFTGMPFTLLDIKRNTTKPRKRRSKANRKA